MFCCITLDVFFAALQSEDPCFIEDARFSIWCMVGGQKYGADVNASDIGALQRAIVLRHPGFPFTEIRFFNWFPSFI